MTPNSKRKTENARQFSICSTMGFCCGSPKNRNSPRITSSHGNSSISLRPEKSPASVKEYKLSKERRLEPNEDDDIEYQLS